MPLPGLVPQQAAAAPAPAPEQQPAAAAAVPPRAVAPDDEAEETVKETEESARKRARLETQDRVFEGSDFLPMPLSKMEGDGAGRRGQGKGKGGPRSYDEVARDALLGSGADDEDLQQRRERRKQREDQVQPFDYASAEGPAPVPRKTGKRPHASGESSSPGAEASFRLLIWTSPAQQCMRRTRGCEEAQTRGT